MSAQGTNVAVEVAAAPDAGTTMLMDDTIGYESQPTSISYVDESVRALVLTPGSRTIEEFLRKPSRLASGSLSATDTGKLFEIDPFLSLYNTSQKGGKLRGIYLFRADVVITLQINAVRFQAGRYILAFMPSFGNGDTTWSNYKYKMHTANLTTITQLPHVEIDLAQQTHVTLRLPFVSAYTHLLPSQTTSASPLTFGSLFMVPYWPLIPGSADTVAPYTVWGHFENIELGSVALPQSGYSIGQKEAKAMGVGPVSAITEKVSKTATILGSVPMLAPATSVVGWISDLTGQVAKVWGFSKPLVQDAPSRVSRQVLPYAAVTDQSITSQPLALVSNNEVVVNSGVSGSKIDEMSFDFIKGVYAYTGNLTWTTSQVADTLLTSLAHDPSTYSYVFGKGFTMAPVAFLQLFFRQWRGGLKFRFKMVKTEFHSGRLRVSYSPGYGASPTVGSISDLDILHQEIIDVRDCSEFEITVPYVSPQIYTKSGVSVGALFIHVLDPLVAPSTVSSTVPIIVEVSGAPDLEFAIPANINYEPYAPVVPMSGYSINPPISLGSASGDHNKPAAIAVGEKINSFRQLLRKFRPIDETSFVYVAGQTLVIRPFLTALVTQTVSNVGPLTRGESYADDYALVSQCYGIASGGMVIRVGPLVQGSSYAVKLNEDVTSSAFMNYTNSRFTPGGMRLLSFSSVEGVLDYVVPAYNRLLGRQVHKQAVCGAVFTQSTSAGTNGLRLEIQNQSNNGSYEFGTLSRSIAEDANLGYFLGVPPLVLTSTV